MFHRITGRAATLLLAGGLCLLVFAVALAIADTPAAAAQSDFATATPLAPAEATQGAALEATVVAANPVPTHTSDQPGVDGVRAIPLNGPNSQQLWAAFTYGLRNFNDNQQHYVAIYQPDGGGYKEAARLVLTDTDYLGMESVSQVQVTKDRTWLTVDSGVGAHSGCFDLLSFDGSALRDEVHGCGSNPAAGSMIDVNGDGTPEAVLNATDYYVFCYACGVTLINYTVMQWDGNAFVEAKLQRLPDGPAGSAAQANNRAMDLADVGLYKDALVAANQAKQLAPQDATVNWNYSLIKLTGDARAKAAAQGPYPILDNMFYGDYEAAVNPMRQYTPAQIFSAQSPLIIGTQAEQWVKEMRERITTTSTAALSVEPDLAPAYFLRAWAAYLGNPTDPTILEDIRHAATLAPNDKLYADSLAYLTNPNTLPGVPNTGAGAGLQLPLILFAAGLLMVLLSFPLRRAMGSK